MATVMVRLSLLSQSTYQSDNIGFAVEKGMNTVKSSVMWLGKKAIVGAFVPCT